MCVFTSVSSQHGAQCSWWRVVTNLYTYSVPPSMISPSVFINFSYDLQINHIQKFENVLMFTLARHAKTFCSIWQRDITSYKSDSLNLKGVDAQKKIDSYGFTDISSSFQMFIYPWRIIIRLVFNDWIRITKSKSTCLLSPIKMNFV